MTITQADIDARRAVERAIVEMVIDDALSLGYTIRIDEMQTRSTDKTVLLENIMAMDEDVLFFLRPCTPEDDVQSGFKRVGFAHFVYGNDGWDALADHTDNEIVRAIVSRANAHAVSLSEGSL